ncbi:hypothetical protein LX32DRAFT_651830 [Colletotrichum zoysiae]|uniref:Uncharacterized protein n=1 Tax=Colletotrichum zoysiae TaxID=1216348 RepID=A0AAD9HJR5_9PEZI|nr:hypothetical protein LX32DRAFT_651830 [Colletotrichum zoysiae]
MRLSIIFNASFIAILSFASSVSAASRCLRTIEGGSYVHKITIEDVGSDHIAWVCNILWEHLKAHTACMVFSPHGCQEADYKGDLNWYFKTTLACNSGMVHGAFWEATRNGYGAISC